MVKFIEQLDIYISGMKKALECGKVPLVTVFLIILNSNEKVLLSPLE